jgi:hypothetical protein
LKVYPVIVSTREMELSTSLVTTEINGDAISGGVCCIRAQLDDENPAVNNRETAFIFLSEVAT